MLFFHHVQKLYSMRTNDPIQALIEQNLFYSKNEKGSKGGPWYPHPIPEPRTILELSTRRMTLEKGTVTLWPGRMNF